MYKFLRSILFIFPPESVHYFSMNCLKLICQVGLFRKILASLLTTHPRNIGAQLTTEIFNLKFRNPVGLGAGFDKNAKYLRELETLGFGFVEIGTVTPLPQEGNPKPRLFRLPKDKALINRMGFNNDGVKTIARRLKEWKKKSEVGPERWGQKSEVGPERSGQKSEVKYPLHIPHHSSFIIGGNIGKNKHTPNEEAWKDYETCFKELHPYVDYFVVNVSSPNTPGLRELQEKESLRKILMHLQMINNGKAQAKPILLKIAPDLTTEQLDDVIDLALEIKLDGLVATNTTISREGLSEKSKVKSKNAGAGGLSGWPLRHRSTEIIKYITEKTKGDISVIASGGIFTGADAREKLDAGASLVQVWTGFIYEGPGIVKRICKHLSKINN